jgi:serine/threonine protein kinase
MEYGRPMIQDWLEGCLLAGRYRLHRRIGSGGFGVVYLAEDTRVHRIVAVKLLSRQAMSQSAITRFQREAWAAGRVGHEGIAAVTDFDCEEDGTPFLVMEYVDGESLATCIDREQLIPAARALSIAARIAQALAAAHAAGIVHRDLKPANVLLTQVSGVDDVVKIVDFGVSKFVSEGSPGGENLTEEGQVVGTPSYMSPEQGMALRDIDGRTDVYALGVILYQMLTGKVPFAGKSSFEMVHLKLTREPPPPSAMVPSARIPPEVESITLRALQADPERRFQSMESFDAALRGALARMAPGAAHLVRPARAGSSPPVELGRQTEALAIPVVETQETQALEPEYRPPTPPHGYPSPSTPSHGYPSPPQAWAAPPRRRRVATVLAFALAGLLAAVGTSALLSSRELGASPRVEAPADEAASRALRSAVEIATYRLLHALAEPSEPAAVEPVAVEPEPAVVEPEPPVDARSVRTRRKRGRDRTAVPAETTPEPDARQWGEPIDPFVSPGGR